MWAASLAGAQPAPTTAPAASPPAAPAATPPSAPTATTAAGAASATQTTTKTTNSASASAPPAPACPRAGAAVVERFISADCPDCWSAPDVAAAPPGSWVFDWIAHTPAGSEAPLASAASTEAQERAQRAGGPSPTGAQMLSVRSMLPRATGVKLNVQSGPAWNGYFGLRLEARGRVPAGSTAWLALVEMIPANTEGSVAERQLVRSVAGPLPLDGLRQRQQLSHLSALRWPETAQPTRLQARGWIEGPDGALLAIASDRCPLR